MDKPHNTPNKGSRSLPPVGKRWEKGQSGNPSGRPKKSECLTTLLKEEIDKICPADREGRKWQDLVVRATLQLAMKGNSTALKEVWDRIDGKVPQLEKVQLEGRGGDVTIRVIYENAPEDNAG